MQEINFYHPQAIAFSDGLCFPIFYFTEELRKLAPEVDWTIIGKPMAMLDCHVAQCYGKQTKDFNKQVERNREYFCSDWCFQPTPEEWKALKSIASQRLTELVTKCRNLSQPIENKGVTEPAFLSLNQIFGAAATNPSVP